MALVHSALHHATCWKRVLREMVRVTREALVIDESTYGTVVRLAVWLRFSADRECAQSGNTVTRFSKEQLGRELNELDVREWHVARWWLNTSDRFRWLSVGKLRLRRVMSLFESEASLRVQSLLLDRIGNRLTIYAKL